MTLYTAIGKIRNRLPYHSKEEIWNELSNDKEEPCNESTFFWAWPAAAYEAQDLLLASNGQRSFKCNTTIVYS